jgi:diguanylate cyclase (GGDEF)-like protein
MQQSTRRLFFFLSAIILITDITFVTINYRADQDSLETSLQKQAVNIERSLNLTISLVYENMQQLASFIGNDVGVQQVFLNGRNAVLAEGGGAGAEEANKYRQQLYQMVSPSWNKLMENFDARQLHFHLGPGSLSYLRVHKPEKFGDRMDEIRHIIVDTYADREPKSGFETGRVYSGLRGTVPIVVDDGRGPETLVGVLEVGTSFKTVLHKLKERTGLESLVLLRDSHIKSIMWPQFIGTKIKRLAEDSPCFLESASSDRAINILKTCHGLNSSETDPTVVRREFAGRDFAVTRIPLFDYRAQHRPDASKQNVGAVLILTDITRQIELTREHLRTNIQIAVIGFLIIESLLFFGLRLAVTGLQALVDERTNELKNLKDFFEDQSQHDGLTGLYNHHTFVELLQTEIGRSDRYGGDISLLMLDLDHFKHINDTYGHSVGDQVLEAVSAVIDEFARQSDIAARYGGEEFCLLLPNTDLEGGVELAERLLVAIRDIRIDSEGSVIEVTSSIGVAQWQKQQLAADFINTADEALYRAKHSGRDQVIA